VRDFRLASSAKRVHAVKHRLCWICGQTLGRYLAFTVGPMCAVNLNTSEPPSHRECAEFAAKACPFLTLPDSMYRDKNLPEDAKSMPHLLAGNPGGAVVWVTRSFEPYRVPGSPGAWLIRIGPAVEVQWWVRGHLASRAEALALLEARLPLLEQIAAQEGPDALAALAGMVTACKRWLPDDAVTRLADLAGH